MIPWLLLTGAITILGQVVLLRELNVAFYGSELIYVLALGLWLAWTALGAGLGRRGFQPSDAQLRLLLLAYGLLLPASASAIRGLRPLFGALPGAYLPFHHQLAAMAISLLPTALLAGLLFQWTARRYVNQQRGLARAYAIESAGGLFGGLLATGALALGVPNLGQALGCGLLGALGAALPSTDKRPRWVWPALALTAAPLLLGLLSVQPLDAALTRLTHPQLAFSRDTPYGRVTIDRLADQVSVFQNDALVLESQGTQAEELAHPAALHARKPMRVLLLGGCASALPAELLKHRPGALDCVELDEAWLDPVAQHLPRAQREALEQPQVQLHVADPRSWLEEAWLYELLLVAMPQPDSGQANRFYTQEFFEICAQHLAPGGVLALRLEGAENLWTAPLLRRNASVLRAAQAAFADVLLLPGGTNLLLASDQPLQRDPQELAERWEGLDIPTQLVSGPWIAYLHGNDRVQEAATLLAQADVPTNRDAKPVCYAFTMLLWLSRFFPSLNSMDLPRQAAPILAAGLLLPWLALALLVRRRSRSRRALLAGAAGFLGMVSECALLLHHQTRCGALYQDLGLLLTLFMAGLAAGAWAGDRLLRQGRRPGMPALLVLMAANLFLARLSALGATGGLPLTALLLLVCGACCALLFAHATGRGDPHPRRAVSPLYAADLAGGCLGSLAASLLLVPFLGLGGSALLLAALALFLVLPVTGRG